MFAQAQAGDTIITLEVPRLARSTQQLCEIIERVREKHLRLVIVGSITLDCRQGQADPMSEAFLQMAGVFSQLELAMIRSRVRSGMANAKAKGKQIGRPQTAKDSIPAFLPPPLPRIQERTTQYNRTVKGLCVFPILSQDEQREKGGFLRPFHQLIDSNACTCNSPNALPCCIRICKIVQRKCSQLDIAAFVYIVPIS